MSSGQRILLEWKNYEVTGMLSMLLKDSKSFLSLVREELKSDDQDNENIHQRITDMALAGSGAIDIVTLDGNKLTTETVEFDVLRQTKPQHAVREIDPEHVKKIQETLLEDDTGVLMSMLTVVRQGQYMHILDGSHRYNAMINIRQYYHHDWFDKVPVLVYDDLSAAEAIGVAFAMNRDDSKGLKMTDYDVVMSLRRVIEDTAGNETDILETCYRLMKAKTVSIM